MLHAQVTAGAASWIVALTNGVNDICILRICAAEQEANTYASGINAQLIPHQRTIVETLEKTQNVLRDILSKVGPIPQTSDDFVLSVRKAIRYIELGKTKDSN